MCRYPYAVERLTHVTVGDGGVKLFAEPHTAWSVERNVRMLGICAHSQCVGCTCHHES